MFKKPLLPDTLRAIKLVSKIPTVSNAYLAGGTGLSLHLGHRISVDLDFFSKEKFREESLSLELSKIPKYKEEGKSWQTVWGLIGETKFSLFYYKYPLLKDPENFEGIKVTSKEDIAAMKINAIEDRGTRRDFIDLYFLTKEFSMDQMLKFYDDKYKHLDDHLYSIIRAFTYFEDAEQEVMPKMLEDADWGKIKGFFVSESERLWKKVIRK